RTVAIHSRLENGTPVPRWPLVCQWSAPDNPLPTRTIRAPGRYAPVPGAGGPPFDFSEHVQHLCADISRGCDELRHLDVSRMLFAVTKPRNGHAHGFQARVPPLRSRDGQLTRLRRGVTYQVQRYLVGASDILYLVTFCLPRFLDLDFNEKLVTL